MCTLTPTPQSQIGGTTLRASPFLSLLALGAASLAALVPQPAQAYAAISNATANDSDRAHDTNQGVTRENYNGPIASGGGSVGTGGTVSTSFVSDTDSWGGIAYSGYAFGSANLNTGSLHVVANSTYGQPVASGLAQVHVRWMDDITFTTAGAGPGTTRSIVVDLQLTGALSQELNFSSDYAFQIWGMGGGGGEISRLAIFDSVPGPSYNDFLESVDVLGFDSWQVLSNTVGNMHFRGVVSYTGASKSFGLNTALIMRCTDGTSCDFGNSARLSFELPPDVTYTSASGVLLTAAVPEPGSQLLMLAGLLGLGWSVRRRMLLLPAAP